MNMKKTWYIAAALALMCGSAMAQTVTLTPADPASRPGTTLELRAWTGAVGGTVRLNSDEAAPANPIKNYGRVAGTEAAPEILRGAQPGEAGVRYLRSIGVKTVVDLRRRGSDDEGNWCASSDIRYINVPLSGFFAPDRAREDEVQSYLVDRSLYPIFIHCQYGMDRTGTAVATYRVLNDCQTYDSAISEAFEDYHMHRTSFLMRRYVRLRAAPLMPGCSAGAPQHWHWRPYNLLRIAVPFLPLIDIVNSA